ncbi:unnamed protein product [Meloidogyne enterolobii]|uniref:Uncharacterized protein n=1 Tax=Meloidogyne enterolobii TaxID=390850 RepID=A0ACB1B4D8_MELEN
MVVRLRADFLSDFSKCFFFKMCNCGNMEWSGGSLIWGLSAMDGGRTCFGWWKNMPWIVEEYDLGAFNCCVVEWKNMLLAGGKNMIWGLSAAGWWKNMPLNGGRTCFWWWKQMLILDVSLS